MDGTVFEAENIEYPQEPDMTFPGVQVYSCYSLAG